MRLRESFRFPCPRRVTVCACCLYLLPWLSGGNLDPKRMSHSNGVNGVGDSTTSQWLVGLINGQHKYLTSETFGFKLNANGPSLRKKQLWTLEPASSGDNPAAAVCLRSHLDRYMSVDQYGNVTGDSTEKDVSTRFSITVDNEGRWAFQSATRGYFLGASGDKLVCDAKVPGTAELWTVHLAARPQVNIRSVGRKRFAHLSENLDEVHVDAAVPWGEDTLFTLEFRDNKYAIHTCNNKYVHPDGKLVDKCGRECCFSLEFHGGYLALRDVHGRYLSPIGSKAVLRTRSSSVTKDELFSLEDSLPQASFVAFNNRYVSVKQGVDVTANQDEVSDHETFQLEFDKTTKRWYLRTMQDKYWALETAGGIQANADKGTSNCLFDLLWQQDGSVAFRANNGKYVAAKKSGHLFANSEAIDETSKFHFYLINRPILVLKCEQGFVGYKSNASTKLDCNKASYEVIQVQRADKGICYFKGQNGKYWRATEEGTLSADSDTPLSLLLELREPSKMCIKTSEGNYIVADKNGLFKVGGSDFSDATLWEY